MASASELLIADSIRRSTPVAKSRSPLGISAPICLRPCIRIREPASIARSAASSRDGHPPRWRRRTGLAVGRPCSWDRMRHAAIVSPR